LRKILKRKRRSTTLPPTTTSTTPDSDNWEKVLFGDGFVLRDSVDRLIYDAAWFQDYPKIDELLHQDVRGDPVGYDIPKFTNKGIIKLWWSVTDNECGYNPWRTYALGQYPEWARVSVPIFLKWLSKLGFTGASVNTPEWRGQ
jgi:hypothetical protein